MSRHLRLKPCPRCRALIGVGDDADMAAFEVRVDPVPLTRDGELRAVVAGRHVYELNQRRLYHRSADLLASPARGAVVTDHRCGEPIPHPWRADAATPVLSEPTEEPLF